jgi:hypothetical protein
MFTAKKVAETQKQIAEINAAAQLRMTEINADVRQYETDAAQIDTQYNGQFALELSEYKNAGFQTGILTLAIAVTCILYILKKRP